VRLKDFGRYAQARTAELKAHAERLAAEANRPLLYLRSPHTARTGYTKEQLARDIAERDGDCEKFCVSDRRERGVTWKSPKPVSRLLPCGMETKNGTSKRNWNRRLSGVYAVSPPA